MNKKSKKQIIKNARKLRKEMTKEENHLWYDFLKTYSLKFVRQKIIDNYIVDFYCASKKIAIELDGSQHYKEESVIYDKKRTAFLNERGITVIRIPNNEIWSNFIGVCEHIDRIVKQ